MYSGTNTKKNPLIANSIKHNPPYTTVKVNIHTEASKQIKIIIEDDGIGMEEEVLEHLFNRYYRGTNSSSHSGSGLGMAIARQIILAHDGSIKINTFPNQYLQDRWLFTIKMHVQTHYNIYFP